MKTWFLDGGFLGLKNTPRFCNLFLVVAVWWSVVTRQDRRPPNSFAQKRQIPGRWLPGGRLPVRRRLPSGRSGPRSQLGHRHQMPGQMLLRRRPRRQRTARLPHDRRCGGPWRKGEVRDRGEGRRRFVRLLRLGRLPRLRVLARCLPYELSPFRRAWNTPWG